MRSRPVRVLAAALAVPAVLAGVTACQVKSGAAAFVGSVKFSEDDVSTYLSDSAATTSNSSSGLTPRETVLNTLVTSQLFRDYLASNGGVPSDADLAGQRDAAFQFFGESTPEQSQLEQQAEAAGYTKPYAALVIAQVELEYAMIKKSGASTQDEFVAKLTQATPVPKISERYGSWDGSNVSITGGSSFVPPYLTRSSGSTGA